MISRASTSFRNQSASKARFASRCPAEISMGGKRRRIDNCMIKRLWRSLNMSATRNRRFRQAQQAFAGHIIDDIQDAKAAIASELIMHRIQRPSRVRPCPDGDWHACSYRFAIRPPFAHRQPFLAIQPLSGDCCAIAAGQWMICSSAYLVRLIVHSFLGSGSNPVWWKNPGAGQSVSTPSKTRRAACQINIGSAKSKWRGSNRIFRYTRRPRVDASPCALHRCAQLPIAGGNPFYGDAVRENLRSTRTAFSPPKAKALDSTTSILASRASFATTSSAQSGSGTR